MNGISQKLMEVNNFTSLNEVQKQTLTAIQQKNRDLIIKADTGTGKTHAFLFALLELINPEQTSTQAIIIAPTRELALQIYDFAKPISELDSRYQIEVAIGGVDSKRLEKRIQKQPHLIISTPGKLLDLMNQGLIRLDTVKACVLDEMDMILDYGFIQDIHLIASKLQDETRFMLFSATFPSELKPFVRKYLRNPLEIEVTSEEKVKPQIQHILINQKHRPNIEAVLDVLGAINPSLAILFTNTKKEAQALATSLNEYGVELVMIHGDVESRHRKQVLQKIKNGHVHLIVATDLAARGLDLPEISHVINLGMPNHDLSFYIHRAGRTGRSGREGYCLSIVSEKDKPSILRLEKQGIAFTTMQVSHQQLIEARPFIVNRPKKIAHDADVVRILNRKTDKVKPNYKKRRKQEIERIMARKRRDKIREEIKIQKKERAKAKSKNNK